MHLSWRTYLLAAVLIILPVGLVNGGQLELKDVAVSVQGRALRHGDQGPAVTVLQSTLLSTGFNPGPVDGIFGPLTEAAVKRAQVSAGITVDGLAGRRTLAALQQQGALTFADALPASSIGTMRTMNTAPMAQDTFSLTFHGRPEPDMLPKILEALGGGGHRATFFLHGEAAQQRPDLAAQIADAGHELGNLGWAPGDMTAFTKVTMEAQLERAQQAIADATGRRPAFFRPPDGRFNERLLGVAAKTGLAYSLWTNVGALDSVDTDPHVLADLLAESVYPGAVLMIHQDRPATVAALPLLLETLKQMGYVSVPLTAPSVQ